MISRPLSSIYYEPLFYTFSPSYLEVLIHGLLTAFIAYLVVLFLVALYSNYRANSMSDFVIGGRSIVSPVAALSAGASDMSEWLLLGLPGAISLSGLVVCWIVFGLVVGALLNWSLVAKR